MVLANAQLIDQFSHAFQTMGATWVLWLLIVLSILSVAVMIERAIFFATHSIGDVDHVARQLAAGELDAAVQAVGDKRGLEAEVVRQGVKAAPLGPDAVEEVVQAVIVRERLRYERFLAYLGTLGNNAPFIGLFGTVLGIIDAFAALADNAASGSMTSGSSNIMHGISEALVATAVGLLVALPAVAVFNAFGRWLKTIIGRSEALGHALAAHLKALPPEPGEQAQNVGLARAANK